LLEGFEELKQIKDKKKFIEDDLHEKRLHKPDRSKEDEDEEKLNDKNRNFLNEMRPPFIWNFFEDCEKKTPHVLRHNAAPH